MSLIAVCRAQNQEASDLAPLRRLRTVAVLARYSGLLNRRRRGWRQSVAIIEAGASRTNNTLPLSWRRRGLANPLGQAEIIHQTSFNRRTSASTYAKIAFYCTQMRIVGWAPDQSVTLLFRTVASACLEFWEACKLPINNRQHTRADAADQIVYGILTERLCIAGMWHALAFGLGSELSLIARCANAASLRSEQPPDFRAYRGRPS